ncbi:MAG: ABC transporter permease [Defluviitaleaceae bacterium]|nr:ABC transporter permease [Defluviitaleaceae bacterium]
MLKLSNNTVAVFIKQLTSNIRQPVFLGLAGVWLVMGLVFAFFSDQHVSQYVSMFMVLIVGMQLTGVATSCVTEDRTTMNLRFMGMAGVKPRQYCTGTFAAVFLMAMFICVVYAVVGGYRGTNFFIFLGFTWLASAVSALLGITMGLSKWPWLTTPVGMLLGLAPMIAAMNENMEDIFRFLYTLQIRRVMDYMAIRAEEEIYEHICEYCGEIVMCIKDEAEDVVEILAGRGMMEEAIIVTLINGAIVLGLFIFMHRKYGLNG